MVPTYDPKAVDNGASLAFFGPKIPEKKFLRDTLNHDDIAGSRWVKKKEKAVRDLLKVDDIPGAKPNIPYLHKEASIKGRNTLDYRDVS